MIINGIVFSKASQVWWGPLFYLLGKINCLIVGWDGEQDQVPLEYYEVFFPMSECRRTCWELRVTPAQAVPSLT